MNSLIVIASLVVLCVVQAQDAATTAKVHHHSHHSHAAHAHTTHEPKETEHYSFTYDGKTHDMVVKTGHQCYIMPLTDKQRGMVHDPAQIKKVEAAALKLIIDNTVQSAVDQSVLDHHLAHFCKGSTTITMLANN
ncbi:uncharacterized protein LOC124136760 [Haliotis rufescens]|uniref:uncharacterized protein LOC124136760 n=1 Tax=Haliotis rufescens TaxID=6454 RepID=UPI001EB00D15|nr:uncharacterized protein LOC124136760 [Haliotis rufescens]